MERLTRLQCGERLTSVQELKDLIAAGVVRWQPTTAYQLVPVRGVQVALAIEDTQYPISNTQ